MRYRWGVILICLTLASFILPQEPSLSPTITIFIHGSVGLRPYLAFNTVVKIICDDIHDSPYHHAVEILRADPIYYDNQAIQGRGFLPIPLDTPHTNQSLGAWLIAKIFDQFNHDSGEHQYYTYGWSGLISVRERYLEAQPLYHAIKDLREKNPTSKIRVIGYSHGGNIALYLAAIRNQEYQEDTFAIDELILIGTPIQRENEHCICSLLFKKVYNFYSHQDRVQRMDCFSLNRFFSRRHFKDCSRYTVPPHVTQVELRVAAHSPQSSNKKRVDRSPGHSELWFFAWPASKNHLYRRRFPLYPLPMICFISEIIRTIEEQLPDTPAIVFEWRVHESTAVVRKRHRHTRQLAPFIPHEKLAHLCADALSHAPYTQAPPIYEAQPTLCSRIMEGRMGARNHYTHSSRCGA